MRYARLGLMVLGLLLAFARPPAYAQAAAPPGSWTAADCETCHATGRQGRLQAHKHAGLDQSCASCHANVAEHVRRRWRRPGPAAVALAEGRTRPAT